MGGERMSDTEALLWSLEKDPSLRSDFLNITLLEGPPDLDRLRQRMQDALPSAPRLCQRVVSAPARLAPPRWDDDPHFDLDHHVRRMAVPPPGGERELLDLAAALYEDPFDRARPLWQFTVVEGLAGGRAALLSKMHHAVTDGEGGLRLSMLFLDLSPEGSERQRGASAPADGAPARRRVPLPVTLLANAGTAALHQLRELGGAARHPSRVPRAAVGVVQTGRSVARQVAVVDRARSPLWNSRRSLRRRFEALSLDLDGARRAAKALGGTVNDVFVAAVAGGVGAYHRDRGADVGTLRMSMPVSTRSDRSPVGNAFTPLRVTVPTGAMPPAERLEQVRARLTSVKSEPALSFSPLVATAMNAMPTSIAVGLARQQVRTVDFAASNLRGVAFDLYVAGARVIGNHPMGPTGGTAFNATVLSYLDRLDMGINVDAAAVEEPEALRDAIRDAFEELAALG